MTTTIIDSPIMPTGTCFDDAFEFFEEVLNIDRLVEHAHFFRIVHGILTGTDRGEPFAHGWIEQLACDTWYRADAGSPEVPREMVWQAGTVDARRVWFALARDDFYRGYRVQSVTRYTVQMAAELNKATRHLGPWRREYRELAGREDGSRIYGRSECGPPLLMMAPTAEGVQFLRPRER